MMPFYGISFPQHWGPLEQTSRIVAAKERLAHLCGEFQEQQFSARKDLHYGRVHLVKQILSQGRTLTAWYANGFLNNGCPAVWLENQVDACG